MANSKRICERCAERARTCCQETEIYVSPLDVERIAESTNSRDFFEFRPPCDPSYRPDEQEDPIWAGLVFQVDGTRRILKHKERGNCIFLSATGCVLPVEVRPLVCRIHPFEYSSHGLLPEISPQCPSYLMEPDENILESIQLKRSDAAGWHDQLYREIKLERRATRGQ